MSACALTRLASNINHTKTRRRFGIDLTGWHFFLPTFSIVATEVISCKLLLLLLNGFSLGQINH